MLLDTAAAPADRAAARCFDATRKDLFFASKGRSAILATYTRMTKEAEVAAAPGAAPNAEPTIAPEVALAASLGPGVETAPTRVITTELGVKKAPLPLATLRLLFIVARSLRRLPTRLAMGNACGDWVPFAGALGVVMLAFYGLAYSLLPWLVVDLLTIWSAASSTESLWIIFVGACVVLPVIADYTVFNCRVFQGKATALKY